MNDEWFVVSLLFHMALSLLSHLSISIVFCYVLDFIKNIWSALLFLIFISNGIFTEQV